MSEVASFSHAIALTYEVYILTGDCRGAGTEADIKLTLFGEHGSSGERPLLKSMNHPRKFCRGQVNSSHSIMA